MGGVFRPGTMLEKAQRVHESGGDLVLWYRALSDNERAQFDREIDAVRQSVESAFRVLSSWAESFVKSMLAVWSSVPDEIRWLAAQPSMQATGLRPDDSGRGEQVAGVTADGSEQLPPCA